MKFKPSPRPTVGVEWELQLIDPETLDLFDGILPLMEFFPATTFVKPEYIQSCVELTSCIAENSSEAIEHLQETLLQTLRRCDELDMSVCAAGTHPFCRRLALITPLPRYQRLAENGGYLAYQQITFSAHVHIGMKSGDQAMRVMSRLIPIVPALVAISANSPFWRGHDTGHAAYRHRILAAAPNYGLPTSFENWQAFETFLAAASKACMIRHFKDIHWDIRPHPDFGTLEIRAMDSASDLRTLHGIVALARCLALAVALASDDELAAIVPLRLPVWAEKQNRFRAGLLGVDAEYIVDAHGNHRPMREILDALFTLCRPVASAFGEVDGLAIASQMLHETPAFQLQRDIYSATGSARAVVSSLRRRLLDDIDTGNDHRVGAAQSDRATIRQRA
jgi:carboxylate-amine ligase